MPPERPPFAEWPETARIAAIAAVDYRTSRGTLDISVGQAWLLVSDILNAVAPLIRDDERQRLAGRRQMADEVRRKLDDAFQFTEDDGSRHSHVTRAWVEALLVAHSASVAAAEAESQ